jgi:hypothetical protein
MYFAPILARKSAQELATKKKFTVESFPQDIYIYIYIKSKPINHFIIGTIKNRAMISKLIQDNKQKLKEAREKKEARKQKKNKKLKEERS